MHLPVNFEGSGNPAEWDDLLEKGILAAMVEQEPDELARVESIRRWCDEFSC